LRDLVGSAGDTWPAAGGSEQPANQDFLTTALWAPSLPVRHGLAHRARELADAASTLARSASDTPGLGR
jgi:hypothetical protein